MSESQPFPLTRREFTRTTLRAGAAVAASALAGCEQRHTIRIVGTHGFMGLVGYDWAPQGVDLATQDQPQLRRYAMDARGYVWQQGAALAAESLVTGRELLVTPEHALHVLEIITAARESSVTGKRVTLTSTFAWPVVTT